MAFYSTQIEKTKAGTVIIRSPEAKDAKTILDFLPVVFSTGPYLITEPDEYSAATEDAQKEIIEKAIKAESTVILIAEVDGKIVGHMDFHARTNRRRISHKGSFGMSVHPDYQQRGIGSAMLKHLILWTKSHPKVEVILLGVLAPNFGAIQMYKKFGFIETGKDPYGVKLTDGSYLEEISMSLKVK